MQIQDIFIDIFKEEMIKEYLSELKFQSEELYLHSLNVCFLSLDLGISKGITGVDLKYLGYAGLYHDIGKLNLPKNLMEKVEIYDSFSPVEWEKIKECPRRGFMSLKYLNLDFVSKIIISSFEYNKTYLISRKFDRRAKKRLNFKDRREYNIKVKTFAQIISVADIFVENYTKKKIFHENLTKKNINTFLKEEFLGNDNYVNDIIKRISV